MLTRQIRREKATIENLPPPLDTKGRADGHSERRNSKLRASVRLGTPVWVAHLGGGGSFKRNVKMNNHEKYKWIDSDAGKEYRRCGTTRHTRKLNTAILDGVTCLLSRLPTKTDLIRSTSYVVVSGK